MSDNHYSLLNPDGTNFKPNEKTAELIVRNDIINQFINSNQDSSKSLIVGQKGSGKSIFISFKSYQDRTENTEKNIGRFFIPEQGIEKITFDEQLSSSDIAKNIKYTDWEKIFNVSIYYFLLAKLSNQLFQYEVIEKSKFAEFELHQLFNPFNLDLTKISFSSILSKCVKERHIIYKSQVDFISAAKHIIRSFLSHKEVIVYFDNLDQALFQTLAKDDYTIAGTSKKDYTHINLSDFIHSSSFSFDDNIVQSWLKCHIGYLLSIYEINNLERRRLRVFSTFRLEAFEYFEHLQIRNKPQLRAIACKIEYSTSDYENIYSTLLDTAAITKKRLAQIGLDELPHAWVKNSYLNKESLWNFIRRHTFGNPREITYQIKALEEIIKEHLSSNKIVSKEELVLKFKESISEKALKHIIKDFQDETLPFFPFKHFERFYSKNQKNWIAKKSLNKEDQPLIVILYRLGLLGIIQRKGNGNGNSYEQRFLEKNVYFTNHNIHLPESDFYVFHPTLDHILLTKFRESDFYYPHCIIGDRQKFLYLKDIQYYLPKGKVHEHFKIFYKQEKAFEKYYAIRKSIIDNWSIKIWDQKFNGNNGRKQDWYDILRQQKESINIGTRRNENQIEELSQNYIFRVILCFSAITGLIKNQEELIKNVFFKGTFLYTTYFYDVRGRGNKQKRYWELLSNFEQEIILNSLEYPKLSIDLQRKTKKDYKLKIQIQNFIYQIKEKLSSY